MSDTLSEIKHSVAKKGKKMYEKKKNGQEDSFSSSSTNNADSLVQSGAPVLEDALEASFSEGLNETTQKSPVEDSDYKKVD